MRNPKTQARATALRRSLTDAERHLWYFLRRRNLQGYRFRRQAPVGPFIIDFLCIEARLAIELDGSQHASARIYDEQRERMLAQRGIRVLRFWNNEVLQRTEAVLQVISVELDKGAARSPHPDLPP